MEKKDMPKRLLCIVGGINAGGAETFLMKIYRALDKSKYQMDFYVSTRDEGFYDKEILSMGGRIFHSVPKTKNPIYSFKKLIETVRKEKYNYVMRVSQHSLSTLDLIAAKIGGAKTLIYRSSNSKTGGGAVNQIMHLLFKWLPMFIPDIKLAPSTEAAEFMFGKNCVKSGRALIIKNAIPLDVFEFDKVKRDKIRKEFNLDDKFVIGHVGRFSSQKNHNFLVKIFAEVLKKHDNSILMLVGKGELESDIKKKVQILGFQEKVIFTGVRSDLPEVLMAMDAFVFPSFFEGMPNAVIEAQATGLPCIISDTITKEVNITGRVEYVSLNSSPTQWAEVILKYKNGLNRNGLKDVFVKNGYDIESVTKNFEKIIFK